MLIKEVRYIKRLRRVVNTLIKYLPYISNTIQYPQLINGPIKGINNKIKRVAYGYRSFNNFKDRILIISRIFVGEHKNVLSKNKLLLSTLYLYQLTLIKSL
ncbi:transposase [Staphylococcus chromogenes]|uniref:transposase n=1 Tax=Staphylococcus chromogenes TaxID=46126 RepID=UPI002886582E|nr:transposase [Staphylococcus chromogenes]MDT0715890.1 transposase [Staphylococcus chromogenes]